jgi:hypothetical protein
VRAPGRLSLAWLLAPSLAAQTPAASAARAVVEPRIVKYFGDQALSVLGRAR